MPRAGLAAKAAPNKPQQASLTLLELGLCCRSWSWLRQMRAHFASQDASRGSEQGGFRDFVFSAEPKHAGLW